MLSVDLAHRIYDFLLVGAFGIRNARPSVDEVVKAGQLAEPDLAAQFVEPGQAMFAVTNDIQRRDIDLRVHPGAQIKVLQEPRMVPEFQQAKTLAPHRQPPVHHAVAAHRGGGTGAKGFHRRDSPVAQFQKIRNKRMQAVDGGEFFREIERGAEMIGAAIHVRRVGQVPLVHAQQAVQSGWKQRIAAADDARSRGEGGKYLVCLLGVLRPGEPVDDTGGYPRQDAVLSEQPAPVRVHADIQRPAVEQLRRPFDRMNLGDFGRHDQARDLIQLLVRDFCITDRRIRACRIA